MSSDPDMNVCRKSDDSIVPSKSANKGAGAPAPAEPMEGRGSTKENVDQADMPRTQSRKGCMSHGLARVRETARKDKRARFTALLHHVTVPRLHEAFKKLRPKAAVGVDRMTKNQYGSELEKNLQQLHTKIHRGSFRAKPSRRAYIDKSDGTKRPLGVAALEDKVVQRAVADVMGAIYEEDFLGFSYGFRPERRAHDGLDALTVGIEREKVNWVLDADIGGFFDSISHEWLIKFVEHRIGDRRIIRLITKWLKAGVMEEGKWHSVEEGTPQGAVISPLLANIYMHYVFDLWADQWRKTEAKGDVIIVRYADDFVLGFEHRGDAERFLEELKERLGKFELTLHPKKTRLIEFGRFAASNREERGKGKPETFDFLGFTHYCGETWKNKRYKVGRKTIKKRLRGKLRDLKFQLMKRRHDPVAETGKWVRSVLYGYYNYHAIPGNYATLVSMENQTARSWLHALSCRSQRGRMSWEKFRKLLRAWMPAKKIRHEYPNKRFDASDPR